MIGQVVDGYEILQEAGRGSTATVYVARQHPVERYVALKVFDRRDTRSTDRLRALLAQLETLDHTNLLPVYASGLTGDQVYAVMRYMPAGTLQAKLRTQRFTLDAIERVSAQVAAALDYAQQHGLTHGRLTPSNILFDHAGNAFVADFGQAAPDAEPSNYAAPELCRATPLDAETGVCADAYSLGAILYELLTNRVPIEAAGPEDERTNRRSVLPPRPASINPKVLPAVEAVVMKALAIDPEQRYHTPLDLSIALTQARAESAAASAAEVSPPVRRVSARREGRDRRGWVIGLIGALLLIAVVVALASRAAIGPLAPIGTATLTVSAPSATIAPATSTRVLPAAAATSTPAPTETALAPTATGAAIVPATATATLRPTVTPRRQTFTPAPTISIDPLTLMIPRQSDQTTLILTFHTFVQPVDRGVIGTVGLSVPAIDPYVSEPILAQVGSGEQTLRVGLNIDCRQISDPIVTREVTLTLRDDAGRVLLTQTVEYIKHWCE